MKKILVLMILVLPFVCNGQKKVKEYQGDINFKDIIEIKQLIYFKTDTTLVTGRVIRYNKKNIAKKYIIVTKGKPDNLGWILVNDKYTPPEKSALGSLVTGAAQVIDFIDPIDIPTSRTNHASDASIDSYIDYNKEFIKKEFNDASYRNKISKNLQIENEVSIKPFEENTKQVQIEDKGNYIDGKKEGLWEEYHQNGQLKAKGVYEEGKKNGTWEVFNEQGKLKAKINYRLGIKKKTEKFD